MYDKPLKNASSFEMTPPSKNKTALRMYCIKQYVALRRFIARLSAPSKEEKEFLVVKKGLYQPK